MKIHYLDWAEKIRKKYSQIGEYGFAGATLTFLQGEKHSEPQNGGEERRLMLFFQNLIFCWENSIGVKLSIGNERVLEKSVRLALETAIQKLTSEEKTHFSREVKIARELLEGKEKTEIQMQKSLVFRRWQEGYSWEEISGHRKIREYAERLEETRNRRQELARIRSRKIAGVQSRADARIQSKRMEFAQIQNMEEVQKTEEIRIQNQHMRQRPGMEIKANEAEVSLLEKMQDQSNLVHREVKETADGTGIQSRAENRWEPPHEREIESGKESQRERARRESRLEKQMENLKESIRRSEKQQESQRELVRQEKRQQKAQSELRNTQTEQQKAQSELRNIRTEQQKMQTELIRQQEKLTETRIQLEKDPQIQQIHEEREKEVLEQEREKKQAVRAETSRLEIEKERVRTEHQNRLEAESRLESTAERQNQPEAESRLESTAARQNQPEAESGLENIPEWQNRGGEDASVESKLLREVLTAEPAGMEALERPESSLVYLEAKETADGTGIQSRAENRWENPHEREIESRKESQREIERRESQLEKQIENLKESIRWSEKQQESQRELVRQEKRQQKAQSELRNAQTEQQKAQSELRNTQTEQQKAQSELRNIQTEQQKMQTELIRQQGKLTETRTQLEKDPQIQQMHEEWGKEVLEQEKKRAVREETSRLEIEKERMRTEHQNRLEAESRLESTTERQNQPEAESRLESTTERQNQPEAESRLESTAERQNQPEAESGLENIPEWQNRGGEDASVESKLFREEFTVEPAGMEALERPESSLVYLEAKETADGTGIQSHAERRWERPSEKAHEREIESGKESQREIGHRESRLEKQMEKLKESIHWSEKQQESQREFARQEERQQKTKSELLNIQTELQKVQSEQVPQQEKLTETRIQLEKEPQILKHPESSLVYLESKETSDEIGVQSHAGKQLEIPSEKVQPEPRDTQIELQKMQTELIRQQEKLTETQIQLEKETQILKHPENSLVYLEPVQMPKHPESSLVHLEPENRLFPGAVERMEKNVKTMEKVLERFRVVTETRKSVFSEPHIVEKHSNVRLEKLVSGTLQQKQEKIRTAALQQNHRVRTIKRIIPRLEVLPGNREMRLEILETVGKTSGYGAGQEFTSLPELSTTAKIQYTVPESQKTDRTNVGSEVSAISATLAQTREETRILRKNTGYTRTALIEQEKKIDGIRKELNTQMKQVNEEVRRLMDTQRRDMSVQNLAGKVMKELQRQFRTEKIRRGY